MCRWDITGIINMKNMTFVMVVLFIVAALFTSCKPQKQIVYQPTSPANSFGQELEVPCVDASMDDDEYFREFGTATHINMQSARTAALQAAKDMIFQKLGGYVEGLSESYARQFAGQASQEKIQRLTESIMTQVVQQYVNHAQKTCEKMFDKGANGYTSFYAIQIPAKKMIDTMIDELSKEEELGEFNRDQFRKYAEEKKKQMLENQKKQ